jgi:hypothetical protein
MYIGKQPTVGNFQVCDAITVVNGQAAYTMQVSSTNVNPESANHMLVSLNGVLQKPGSSFTISGATITFASNLATGDVIDFVILLGNVLDLGTPSDGTVTNAKVTSDAAIATTKLGAGAIIQVVTASDTSERSTTSTSFVTGSNGLSVNITPSSSSNKVFVFASVGSGNNTAGAHTYTTIYRDSTNLGSSQGFLTNYQGGTGEHYGGASMGITDSPSTTSQVTYQVYLKVSGGTGKINSSAGTGSITAFEIQG